MKNFVIITLIFTGIFSTSLTAQTYQDFVDRSYEYLEAGDLPAAEVNLKSAMKLEPANPLNVMLLSNLGTIQRRLGKPEEAMVSYSAALGRAPRSTTLLSNRASLYSEMNQPNNAIIDYSSLLEVDDKNEDALYQRGLLYLQIKNYESAQADFEKMMEINPNTLYGRMGIAALSKLRKEFKESETIYYYLIDLYPNLPELYAGRAELYLLMNKSGNALSDINKAIRLQGDQNPNPYYYVIRSKIKLLQYEKKAADADMEKAKSLGYKVVE